jgi:hypothetical protein
MMRVIQLMKNLLIVTILPSLANRILTLKIVKIFQHDIHFDLNVLIGTSK